MAQSCERQLLAAAAARQAWGPRARRSLAQRLRFAMGLLRRVRPGTAGRAVQHEACLCGQQGVRRGDEESLARRGSLSGRIKRQPAD
jgi:hypothetical protein